jgi:hypothetical protein
LFANACVFLSFNVFNIDLHFFIFTCLHYYIRAFVYHGCEEINQIFVDF